MHNWRFFPWVFAASAAAFGVLIATVGWLLPEPYRSYVPPSEIMLTEVVWQRVVDDTPACVVFVGDSRIAFQINAEQISTPSCPARNYGYPSIGVAGAVNLAREITKSSKARTIVLGLTDAAAFSHPGRARPLAPFVIEYNAGQALLSWRPWRLFYLATRRFAAWGETFAGAPPPRDTSWPFDRALGRWVWNSDRVLSSLPSAEQEVAAVATNYYAGRDLSYDLYERFRNGLERLRGRAERVAVLFLPDFPALPAAAERIVPGGQQKAREVIAEAARDAGAAVIDCSEASRCGLSAEHFADPVHVNAEGARRFTEAIKAELTRL
jgi:hypothetical protein